MKFNEGVSQADFDTILRIAKKIGVETGADLQRFKREQVKEGESVVDAFLRYEKELGDDFKLEEALDEESEWIRVASKEVEDSDGFMTEYTWYKKSGEDGDKHIMMFGDSDLYEPDEDYADMVFEDDTEAEQWFHSYEGFSEDDDLWESLSESTEGQGEVTLKVKWREYERHEAGAINVQTVRGDSLQDALLEVLSMVHTAVDAESAETQGLSAQAILEKIRLTNGDGVDFIYYIKDEDTGKVLFHERPLRESVKGKSSAMGRLRVLEELKHSTDEEQVSIYYQDLPIEVPYRRSLGARMSAYGDLEPDDDYTKEIYVSHTHHVGKGEVKELLAQWCSDDPEFTQHHADVSDEQWDDFVTAYVDEHFDDLLAKYEEELQEEYMEEATDHAAELHHDDLMHPEKDALDAYRAHRDEQAINENWCDDALAELEAKPRRDWTEADWDTYHYCKNANAERDWQDAQDDSVSED